MVYLDYNATTPLDPAIAKAMLPALESCFGNPSSIHGPGRAARAIVDDARERVAAVLGARPHEIIFTSGGTESANLAILGIARARAAAGAVKRVITCATEHHAVLHAVEALTGEGFETVVLPVDRNGGLEPELLAEALVPGAALVSVMGANNETGVIHPWSEIAELCAERGVPFHSDMVQVFGKLPLRASDGPDAISLAAHKFYGPKGAGLLWVRAGVPIAAITYGGSHENQRRPGTENVAAIAGLAAAVECASADAGETAARLAPLRERLWDGIRAVAPDAIRNGPADRTLSNTLNVAFPGADGESLLMALDLEGVAASSGSACMVGSIQPSHVLLAMGLSQEVASAAVRFSMGKGTTDAEVDHVLRVLPSVLSRSKHAP